MVTIHTLKSGLELSSDQSASLTTDELFSQSAALDGLVSCRLSRSDGGTAQSP